MKRYLFLLIAIAAVLASCNDYETYGDKKEKERNAIDKFISDRNITVISEEQFNNQGQKTNVEKNEFVKLTKNGVYLQIVREGCGGQVKDGDAATRNTISSQTACRPVTTIWPTCPTSCMSPGRAVSTQRHSSAAS